MSTAKSLRRSETDRLLDIAGVVGVGKETDENGQEVLLVLLNEPDPKTEQLVRETLHEQPVNFLVTGAFAAA